MIGVEKAEGGLPTEGGTARPTHGGSFSDQSLDQIPSPLQSLFLLFSYAKREGSLASEHEYLVNRLCSHSQSFAVSVLIFSNFHFVLCLWQAEGVS
jgi:hypothetical protein